MELDKASRFLQMIRQAERGRLKIYLGYGPGVGKTWKMLEEAKRLKQQGIDVVIGLVETHGRAGTQEQLGGLEQVPRRREDYKGVVMEEMDLDAILARKPQVVLVDELAHTNLPGSRNAKRYQDVRDIQAAGIHVISTLNIQHLESLYDTVEALIKVKVRERIPDSVLAEADEVVNVDLSTADLQERLKAGAIYPQARVAATLENFFVAGKLEQLRELTLRELAAQLDLKRREQPAQVAGNAPDQVLVCLGGQRGVQAALLRYGSRLAGRLNRNWYALYVQTPDEDPLLIDAEAQRKLSDALTLANQLGATVFTFKGEDPGQTILRFAREYRVGHIVLGRPRALPRWRRWMRLLLRRTSVADELVRTAKGFTVVVVDAEEARQSLPDAPNSGAARPKRFSDLLREGSVLVWDAPLTREAALRQLVQAASRQEGLSEPAVWAAVMERETQGSTFLNEGVALPHARVSGLKHAKVLMGVPRLGLVDDRPSNPMRAVVLMLSPANEENQHLEMLSLAAHFLQDGSTKALLSQARSPREVMESLRLWERNQKAR
jgi:two-component system sensor histidine kinase KdpD